MYGSEVEFGSPFVVIYRPVLLGDFARNMVNRVIIIDFTYSRSAIGSQRSVPLCFVGNDNQRLSYSVTNVVVVFSPLPTDYKSAGALQGVRPMPPLSPPQTLRWFVSGTLYAVRGKKG